MGWLNRRDIHGKNKQGLWLAVLIFFAVGGGIVFMASRATKGRDVDPVKAQRVADAVKVDVSPIVDAATNFRDKVKPAKAEEKDEIEKSERETGRPKNPTYTSKPATQEAPQSAPANTRPDEIPGGAFGRPITNTTAPKATTPGNTAVSAALFEVAEEQNKEERRTLDEDAVNLDDPEAAKNRGIYDGSETEPTDPNNPSGNQQSTQNLSRYRRGATSANARTGANPSPTASTASNPQTPKQSGFQTGKFLPRGHRIPVYFLQTVESITGDNMVELGVAENVMFRGRVMLPFGTKLLGSASADPVRDRMRITVDTILYPDGSEGSISGFMKDVDGASGVRGYYIPSPLWAEVLPYAQRFLVLWESAIRTERQNALANIASAIGTATNRQQFSAGNAAADSASDALLEFLNKQEKKLAERYEDYLRIPAGTPAWVQLNSAVDLTAAQIGGQNRANSLSQVANEAKEADAQVLARQAVQNLMTPRATP